MKRKNPRFKKEKAKNVIRFLLSRCGKMSKTKLTYLLFRMDFDYFEKFEETFMGFSYKKMKNGVKAVELDNLLKEL